MKLKGKLVNQTEENGEKPNLGPDFVPFVPNLACPIFFSWVVPLLDIRHCCKLPLYVISRKIYDPKSIK